MFSLDFSFSFFLFLLDFFSWILLFIFYFFFGSEWEGSTRRGGSTEAGPAVEMAAAAVDGSPPPSDFLFLFLFLGGGLVWNEYTAQCPSPLGGGDIREHETPDLSH